MGARQVTQGVTGDNETGKGEDWRKPPTLCSTERTEFPQRTSSGLPGELTEIYVSISYKFFLKWNQKSRYHNIWMFPGPQANQCEFLPAFTLALAPPAHWVNPAVKKKPVFHGSTQHRPCGIQLRLSLHSDQALPPRWMGSTPETEVEN